MEILFIWKVGYNIADSHCDFIEQIQIFVSALLTQSHYQFRKDGALKH